MEEPTTTEKKLYATVTEVNNLISQVKMILSELENTKERIKKIEEK